ncbi:MAG: DUF2442 domain-containing protein [Limnohabitans sp.]
MPGPSTLAAEVTHVSEHGFTVVVGSEELAVPFSEFPWFRSASIEHIRQLERPAEDHLRWPALDIDLAVESLRNPSAFPLIAR